MSGAVGPSTPDRGPVAPKPVVSWPFALTDLTGVRFALNVFIASAILWYVLRRSGETNPMWSIASMIASSDPHVKHAARLFKSRIINVTVGCAMGLLFLVVGGSDEWKLPLTLAVTVLVSSYVVRVPTMWRQAPITAAIVITASLTQQSRMIGLERGLHKVEEVFLGCLTGIAVSYLMSRVWPLPALPDAS
jgi:uncharacterized membrane protein YccC